MVGGCVDEPLPPPEITATMPLTSKMLAGLRVSAMMCGSGSVVVAVVWW